MKNLITLGIALALVLSSPFVGYSKIDGYKVEPHKVFRVTIRDGESHEELLYDYWVSKNDRPEYGDIICEEWRNGEVLLICYKGIGNPGGWYMRIKTGKEIRVLPETHHARFLTEFPELMKIATNYDKFFFFLHYPRINVTNILAAPDDMDLMITFNEAQAILKAIQTE